jgi:mRNA interferase YafQ
MVHVRIDKRTKARAAKALASMGLSVSDAVRVLLTRVAAEKVLPFEVQAPNAVTAAAMREARKGGLVSFSNVPDLMADLNAEDWANQCVSRDFKREKCGQHRRDIEVLVIGAATLLAEDRPLLEKSRDHALTGEWRDHRECHLKPDLLLIYRKPDADILQLVRMGSHSELFD